MGGEFLGGEVRPLTKRSITEATCKKFGYVVGKNTRGEPVQIASYRDASGQIVAQKLRTADKKFSILGAGQEMPLFGQTLWKEGGRRVVVTEGEIDALSVSQAFGNTWPVVSLPNGAAAAKSAVQRAIEFLQSFEEVVLFFDSDAAGRKAADDCAPLFSPGKVRIAELPYKDANEALKAGDVKAITTAVYQARAYRPDGIVGLSEIRDRVLTAPEVGRPWCFPRLTRVTYGRRLGDVIGLGAGSGVGKTDFFTQQIAFDVCDLQIPCGVLYLEQPVGETGKRIAGKEAGRRFWVPDDGWTTDELVAAYDRLQSTNRLFLYDSFGAADWPTISSKIRYFATALGCQHIYLDHLTALAAAEDDERKALEGIMAELAGMAKELNVVLHYVSHLSTPEGKPHEEGGRVMGRHFKGSRAIIFWSHFLMGLERDTQEPKQPTTLRVLKDRFTGQATGFTMGLAYNPSTGRLIECDLPAPNFHNETGERDF